MEDKTVINTPPPPPSEVKIRTMQSDIASMRASGGGAAKFRSVAVAGLSLDKERRAPAAASQASTAARVAPSAYEQPNIPVTHEVGSEEDAKSHILPLAITVVVALAAIVAVGYVAYITFVK